MNVSPFKLEEFWKIYEFNTPYLFCPSDAEPWSLNDVLDLADSESKKLWETLSLGYTETEGFPLLREEISRLYTRVNRDQILTFAGGEEGIYCAMKALVFPKDHVVVVTPCYQSLQTLPEELGAEVTTVALDPDRNWRLSIEDLRKAFRPNTKLLSINYPHNPTGMLLEKEVLDAMVGLCRERGAYLFSDEMYRYLEIDESKRLPSIADAYEKGISLFAMTKPFGLAGLRIGWLASQDTGFIKKAGSCKLYTSICNSAPSELLALMALRAKEKILGRGRQIVLQNLQLLDAFFERQKERVSWTRPESGTIAFPKLLLNIPIDAFTKQLVEKAGVLIMPAPIFDFPGNNFRIGFGRKNMPEVLQRFEEYIGRL